jgi:hypothetical protein
VEETDRRYGHGREVIEADRRGIIEGQGRIVIETRLRTDRTGYNNNGGSGDDSDGSTWEMVI